MNSKFLNYLLVLCISMSGINATASANLNSQNKLCFIENKGQITDQNWQPRSDIDFKLSSNKGLSIFIGHNKILYQFSKEALTNNPMDKQSNTAIDWSRMEVELIGANPDAIIIKEQPSPYYEQYNTLGFRNLKASAFSKIVYKDIYPKIDWVLYVEGDYLKHEFHVHPGGQYSDIKLKYNGTESLQLDPNGNLIASCSLGQIIESAPVSFHQNGQLVASKFLLDHQQLRYDVVEFKGELIIDPSLSWSTYYGGTNFDHVSAVVSNSNSIFCSGSSLSNSNIATIGAYKFSNPGGGADAFVVKMNSDGVRQWATYFGGFGGENGTSIALDNNGAVYLSGNTNSTSGISTAGAHQTVSASSGLEGEAYLAKFSNEGSLIWATYYGGEENEGDAFVATDISGNIFLSGNTKSSTGIATAGAHQTSLASPDFNDAFLAKFNSSGVRQWGTYYGGLSIERSYKVTTDKMGNVYITGQTNSPSAIATMGTHQSAYAGSVGSTSTDGYVAKFNTGGLRQWCTYYGGSGSDIAYAAAIDDSLNVYLVGSTFSTDKIASTAAYQTSWGGGVFDAFIAKLDKNGMRIWGTYYGFIGEDVAYDVAVRGIKDVFISGYSSSNFNIASDSAFQKTLGGGYDAMLLHFNDSGKRVWSSYYGGAKSEYGRGIHVNGAALYMCGLSGSVSGIATSTAHQGSLSGADDGFILKFIFSLPKDPVSIEETAQTHYKLYPNPVHQLLHLESEISLTSISIHNALGQKVYFKEDIGAKEITIDVQHLTSGFYFISANGNYLRQIYKQ
ncbi:MAG: SBBP repeat-containing protein [Bacteroidota bacterium]